MIWSHWGSWCALSSCIHSFSFLVQVCAWSNIANRYLTSLLYTSKVIFDIIHSYSKWIVNFCRCSPECLAANLLQMIIASGLILWSEEDALCSVVTVPLIQRLQIKWSFAIWLSCDFAVIPIWQWEALFHYIFFVWSIYRPGKACYSHCHVVPFWMRVSYNFCALCFLLHALKPRNLSRSLLVKHTNLRRVQY